MPMVEYEERRASVCAYLCISIATVETSDISTGDCFAALCLVQQFKFTLSPQTALFYQN